MTLARSDISAASAARPTRVERPELPAATLEFRVIQLAVFLAPFHSFRLSAFYLTASDCLFFLGLLLLILRGRVPVAPLGVGTIPWILGVGSIFGGLMASSAVNGDFVRGVIVVLQYLFAYLLIPFVIMNRPMREAVSLSRVFLFSMFVINLFGIVLYYAGYKGSWEAQYGFVSPAGRMGSFVENPNSAASLIAVTFPLVLFLTMAREIRAISGILAIATLLVAMVATGSNTGLVATSVAFACYLVGSMSLRLFAGTAAAVAGIGFALTRLGIDILPEAFRERVMPAITSGSLEEAGTFTHRVDTVKEAIGMADETLLLGLGADQYRIVSFYDVPVHNVYLQLLTEGGLIALVGWLFILAGAILIAMLALRARGGHLVGVTGLVSTMVFSVVAHATPHMYARYWVVPLLISLGLSVALANRVAEQEAQTEDPVLVPRPAPAGYRNRRTRPGPRHGGSTP
jgi:O-antigen ligase